MRRSAAFLVLFGLLLPACSPAFAWNSVGHMAVARLAYERLDDGQKARAVKLLQQHPHYEAFLAKNRPDGVDPGEWAFLRASTWPDWVRPRRPVDPRGDDVTRYNMPADHYINEPFVLPGDQALFAGRDLRPNPDKRNVLKALEQRSKELAAAETSDSDKAVALCWLLHLIGDVHQPLHCTALFAAQFPGEDGDMGGNLFAIKVGGEVIKLHLFWDNLPGLDPNYLVDSPENAAIVYSRAKEAAERLHDPRYARTEFKEELTAHTDFPSWVQEGLERAKAVVYQNGALKGAKVGLNGHLPAKAPEPAPEYETQAREEAWRRMALAAYRMEDKLKALLTSP
jgi:hypothetical protein